MAAFPVFRLAPLLLAVACLTHLAASPQSPRPDAGRPLPTQTHPWESYPGGGLRIQLTEESNGLVFRVVGLEFLQGWSRSDGLPSSGWARSLTVSVDAPPGSDLPPMLGSHHLEGGVLIFRPRFRLEPGQRYRAVFHPARAPLPLRPADGEDVPVVAVFAIPDQRATPSTVVEQVYPSADRLPENQLKLYLYFSAPMSRGEAYRRIRLLDRSGQPLELPFLELEEELWDPGGRRLTLLFDPGRIKTGLLPNRQGGAPLRAGEEYTLVIDRGWPDAVGNPLREGFRKTFRVRAADREPVDPQGWDLQVPASGTLHPLTLRFPEPLDHGLLLRLLQVLAQEGRLAGSVRIDLEETRWSFTPEEPWRPGRYRLEVETALEDLAGNRVHRPFEVDVFEQVDPGSARETVNLPFQIR